MGPRRPAVYQPAAYPELSLATTGTHDTEALTVWWRAQPVDVREKLVRGLGLEGKVSPRRMLEESARFAILTRFMRRRQSW